MGFPFFSFPLDPYRSVGVPRPDRKNPGPTPAPWLLLSEQEIAEWRIAHPEATTPSDKIARCLCWLEQEFAR